VTRITEEGEARYDVISNTQDGETTADTRVAQGALPLPANFLAHATSRVRELNHKGLAFAAASRNAYAEFSSTRAMPMPPLTHKVATPRFVLRLSISCISVTVMRAPVHPMG
jgi:hypothetical protein